MIDVEIRPRAFLIGWLVGGVLVYPITIVFLAALWGGLAVVFGSLYRPNNEVLNIIGGAGITIVSGAAIGLCVGVVQRWLLRRYLCWTADRWRRYSAIGGALGAAIAVLVYMFARELLRRRTGYYYSQNDTALMVMMPLFMGVVSVMQWMALRHAVKQALLWVLANVVGGLVFSGMFWVNGPRMNNDLVWIIPFIAVFGQSFITGFVALWLFEKLGYPVTDGDDDDDIVITHTRKPRSVWDEAI